MAIRGLKHRAVLLDALGTLVELEPPAPRLRTELANRFGIQVTEAQAQRAITAEIAYYRQHLDDGRDQAGLDDLRRRCAMVLSVELARSVEEELPEVEAMTGALLGSLSFRPFADVVPVLSALKGQGVRLIVVSNWDASLSGVLERLGLLGWLDGVLTSAQAGARKPDPAIFELALGIAQVPARETVHVGDSPAEDVAGARAAGIDAVLLRRTDLSPSPPPGVTVIRTLQELPAVMSATSPGGPAPDH